MAFDEIKRKIRTEIDNLVNNKTFKSIMQFEG